MYAHLEKYLVDSNLLYEQEMFVKHVCPSNDSLFNIHHWPDKMCILNGINFKINRGHLLVMTLKILGQSVNKLLIREGLEIDCY